MPTESKNASHHISTLNEKPLHAALKKRYSQAYDRFEVLVDGFLVDIVRGDLLIEIQTRNFSAIRRKLETLTADHRVRLVYPIPRDKWLVTASADDRKPPTRRRSPKHGTFEHVFEELVSLPHLLTNDHFSLEVLLTDEEEFRRDDPERRRRRRRIRGERRLVDIADRRVFETPADFIALIPADLGEPFTTAGLATAIGRPRYLAQQMAYCLREMGALLPVGKQGNAILYERAKE